MVNGFETKKREGRGEVGYNVPSFPDLFFNWSSIEGGVGSGVGLFFGCSGVGGGIAPDSTRVVSEGSASDDCPS